MKMLPNLTAFAKLVLPLSVVSCALQNSPILNAQHAMWANDGYHAGGISRLLISRPVTMEIMDFIRTLTAKGLENLTMSDYRVLFSLNPIDVANMQVDACGYAIYHSVTMKPATLKAVSKECVENMINRIPGGLNPLNIAPIPVDWFKLAGKRLLTAILSLNPSNLQHFNNEVFEYINTKPDDLCRMIPASALLHLLPEKRGLVKPRCFAKTAYIGDIPLALEGFHGDICHMATLQRTLYLLNNSDLKSMTLSSFTNICRENWHIIRYLTPILVQNMLAETCGFAIYFGIKMDMKPETLNAASKECVENFITRIPEFYDPLLIAKIPVTWFTLSGRELLTAILSRSPLNLQHFHQSVIEYINTNPDGLCKNIPVGSIIALPEDKKMLLQPACFADIANIADTPFSLREFPDNILAKYEGDLHKDTIRKFISERNVKFLNSNVINSVNAATFAAFFKDKWPMLAFLTPNHVKRMQAETCGYAIYHCGFMRPAALNAASVQCVNNMIKHLPSGFSPRNISKIPVWWFQLTGGQEGEKLLTAILSLHPSNLQHFNWRVIEYINTNPRGLCKKIPASALIDLPEEKKMLFQPGCFADITNIADTPFTLQGFPDDILAKYNGNLHSYTLTMSILVNIARFSSNNQNNFAPIIENFYINNLSILGCLTPSQVKSMPVDICGHAIYYSECMNPHSLRAVSKECVENLITRIPSGFSKERVAAIPVEWFTLAGKELLTAILSLNPSYLLHFSDGVIKYINTNPDGLCQRINARSLVDLLPHQLRLFKPACFAEIADIAETPLPMHLLPDNILLYYDGKLHDYSLNAITADHLIYMGKLIASKGNKKISRKIIPLEISPYTSEGIYDLVSTSWLRFSVSQSSHQIREIRKGSFLHISWESTGSIIFSGMSISLTLEAGESVYFCENGYRSLLSGENGPLELHIHNKNFALEVEILTEINDEVTQIELISMQFRVEDPDIKEHFSFNSSTNYHNATGNSNPPVVPSNDIIMLD